MLDWLKSAWASWKIRVTVVGGALVVATAYGTCSYDPQTVSEADVAPEVEPDPVPVSSTEAEVAEAAETTTTE